MPPNPPAPPAALCPPATVAARDPERLLQCYDEVDLVVRLTAAPASAGRSASAPRLLATTGTPSANAVTELSNAATEPANAATELANAATEGANAASPRANAMTVHGPRPLSSRVEALRSRTPPLHS